MIYIGLDYSSKALHLAIRSEDDETEYVTFRADGNSVDERIYDLYRQLKGYLWQQRENRVLVMCEGQFPTSSKPRATAALTKMWTLIMVASRDTGCEFQEVLPSVWKKAILGSGKASKEDSKVKWNLDDDNQSDARCILEYALSQD